MCKSKKNKPKSNDKKQKNNYNIFSHHSDTICDEHKCDMRRITEQDSRNKHTAVTNRFSRDYTT